MLDLRTLLVLAAAADLALAATLALAGSRRRERGLPQWGSSLGVRALAFALLAWGAASQPGAAAVGSALLALAFTLQAASLLAFAGRGLPAWVHTAAIAAVAVPVQLLANDGAGAVVFGAIAFATLVGGLAAIAWQLPVSLRARPVLVGSFLAVALALLARGVAAALVVDPLAAVAYPAGPGAAATAIAFAAPFASTLGFLLLHQERAEREALRLATMDALTGAYSRRTFHEMAERELARARRAGQPLSIVIFDIDHFRAVNERHGHRVGDELLARLADVVRSALRQEDILVRFGGEEFLVMLPDVPGPGAVVVAGRIRRAVSAEPIEAAGGSHPLTVSLGVAARLDEGPESLEGLLARADSALQLAKQRGRNRVVALSLGRSIAA